MLSVTFAKRAALSLVTAFTLLVAVGCSSLQTSAEGSRHEIFDSLDALVSASSLVVVVDVGEQSIIDDENPTTVSTATVVESFTPDGLGAQLEVAPSAAASQIQVRQMGVGGADLPYPMLEPGNRYLLFLTPSMLGGDEAGQFFVTGASAGIFRADGDEFVHGPFEEGDVLPERLTAADLT